MLHLTRRRGEAVVIYGPDGREVGRVVYISRDGDKVTIGYAFPKEYLIVRPEVERRLKAEAQREATI